jgi:hypothetical protein
MRSKASFIAGVVVLFATLLGPSQPAAAVTDHKVVEFTDDFDTCTGETVEVTGIQRIVEQVTVDESGREHISFTRHTQGTGVGTSSGATYLLIDSVTRSEVTIGIEGDTVLTERSVALFVRMGELAPSDDLLAHLITETTITPDGTTTTVVKLESVECR